MSPFSILLDSNERGSERAKALALVVGGDPTYELQGFAELPVDMQIRQVGYSGAGTICNVELKEIPDFWQSKSSGHLGQQCLEMIAQRQTGFVAVVGSLQEVLAGVPKMKMGEGKPRGRSQMDIASDISTARAFCADMAACGVPVHFLSSNHEQSFRWILSYAKHILTGPNLSSWLPSIVFSFPCASICIPSAAICLSVTLLAPACCGDFSLKPAHPGIASNSKNSTKAVQIFFPILASSCSDKSRTLIPLHQRSNFIL